jgi:hypothetical protein
MSLQITVETGVDQHALVGKSLGLPNRADVE